MISPDSIFVSTPSLITQPDFFSILLACLRFFLRLFSPVSVFGGEKTVLKISSGICPLYFSRTFNSFASGRLCEESSELSKKLFVLVYAP